MLQLAYLTGHCAPWSGRIKSPSLYSGVLSCWAYHRAQGWRPTVGMLKLALAMTNVANDSVDLSLLDADAVVVDGDALDAPELSASGTAEHTAAGQIPNAQPAQPADMVDVDHPDALEPLATGTAENSAAGQIPIAKQAQPADMAPEVSDGVQGAPTEVRRVSSRHTCTASCTHEGHVLY